MKKIVTIDFNRLQNYEAGALLLTHFAYPEEDLSDQERGAIHASLCSIALRQIHRESSEPDFISPQLMKPLYALRDESEIATDLKTFPRRLRDRAIAGRMGAFFLKKASLSEAENLGLPKGMKRISLNEVSAAVLKDSGLSDPENVESRIWRPSLPVIHLAVAMQVMLQKFDKTGLDGFNYIHLMLEPDFVNYVVSEAEEYERLIMGNQLPIPSEQLIKFRIIH